MKGLVHNVGSPRQGYIVGGECVPVDAKQAVKNSMEYLAAIYEGKNVHDFLLEEIDSNTTEWRITVSFARLNMGDIGSIIGGERSRSYKVFTIDKSTGDIKSMKMRDAIAQRP